MNQPSKQLPNADRHFIYGACVFGLAIPIVLLCAIVFHKRQLAFDEKTQQQARQQEAYQAGFDAHERGLDISNAPDNQKDSWVVGWNTAEGGAKRKKAELEARDRADTQAQVPERVESAQRPKERYYRDSHGALVSESEAEEKIQTIRRKIMSMPDNAEKAFMGGVLKSLEEEWARIKRQGPIEQSDAPQSRAEAAPRRGQIDWTLAEKARRSWKEGNFRSADRAEQAAAMLVIVAGIKKAIPDPLDREATLDYVERNIDSW